MPQPATTRLLLVRHGGTQRRAEDRFSGDSGIALSEDGRCQAERLGERLRGVALTATYCSPFTRTLETARIVALHGASARRWARPVELVGHRRDSRNDSEQHEGHRRLSIQFEKMST